MPERPDGGSDEAVDNSAVAVACPRDLPDVERRRLLTAIGGAGVVVLAGCLDEDDPDAEPDDDEPDNDVATYELEFLEYDEIVEVAEDDEILYPALEADVDIPYVCEVGTCGECTALYDGDATEVVTHDGNEYLEDDQIEDGWILTCVAYPDDDFALEVAHPDDE